MSEAALSDTENDNKPSHVKFLLGAGGNGSTDSNADGSPTRIRDVRLDGFPGRLRESPGFDIGILGLGSWFGESMEPLGNPSLPSIS